MNTGVNELFFLIGNLDLVSVALLGRPLNRWLAKIGYEVAEDRGVQLTKVG